MAGRVCLGSVSVFRRALFGVGTYGCHIVESGSLTWSAIIIVGVLGTQRKLAVVRGSKTPDTWQLSKWFPIQ